MFGTYKYDDWDNIILGYREPMKGDKSLVERDVENEEHIKPTEQKRRTADRVKYERTVKKIDDLTKYIRFKHAHKEDFKKDI